MESSDDLLFIESHSQVKAPIAADVHAYQARHVMKHASSEILIEVVRFVLNANMLPYSCKLEVKIYSRAAPCESLLRCRSASNTSIQFLSRTSLYVLLLV